MRYHFVLNGYLQNCQKLMQEMKAFKEMYLSDAEEGITYLYCQSEEIAKQLNGQLTKNVSVLAAEEYVPETVLKGLEELAKPKDIYIFGSDYAGEAGIRTIGMGPARENLAHTIDEYAEVEDLTNVSVCYAGIMKALLG